MLGKQWLQSYQRTGNTGSHREQAILQIQKWMGAESWGLRPVIEALPTLLLISLILFFAALCDFLWSTSQPVAIVIVAFAGTGAVFYGFTVIAAAVDVFCPYQTAVSTVIREIVLESSNLLPPKLSSRNKIVRMLQAHHPGISRMAGIICMTSRRMWAFLGVEGLVFSVASTTWKAWEHSRDSSRRCIAQTRSILGLEEAASNKIENIYAHSILWMLENATEEEYILACAENVPALTSLASMRIISNSHIFSTLVQRFDTAMTHVHNGEGGSEKTALIFGTAVMHVVVADPTRWVDAVIRTLNAQGLH
ncbi:hypothetical protein FRB94_009507 [Tulasnella sp. JGI-2019a]|nr:hypothetical protein FRB94_009507 [Tulasnella sp. JGI-2019a]KAG9003144.1 hypothetical protein FRB93_011224 [Tulasnella sp. JGI-2019a]